MTYTFELDRENRTWRCLNKNDQEVDSGDLPLTDARRKVAIIEDKGLSNPARGALQAIFTEDWENSDR